MILGKKIFDLNWIYLHKIFVTMYSIPYTRASAIIHLWFLCERLIFLALGGDKQRWNEENWETKGQMKSECIYEIIDFPKYHWKNLIDFCHESLFRLGMLCTWLSRVALRIIKTNHMYLAHKTFQGRNLSNLFGAILDNRWFHKYILTLSDL